MAVSTVAPTAALSSDMAGLAVRVVDTADAINDDDWRRVTAGRGFYSSPRWLRAVEEDPWHDVWYVTARDADGLLRGVLPVYLASGLSRAGADSFYDPVSVFASARHGAGVSAGWRPSLLGGGRTGYDTDLLIDPGLTPTRRRAVLTALIERYGQVADAWGVNGRALMYLLPAAARELAPLLGRRPLLTDLTTVMPLEGVSSLDEYVRRLPSHRRGRARRELRDFAASDLTLRWSRLSEVADVVAPLLAAHHRRYGHLDSAAMLTLHLRQQTEALDDLSHVVRCEHAGEVLGALVAFEWDGAWYARIAAAGEGLRGNAFAFFSLVFYAPLAAAIEHGMTRYVVGPSTVAAKVRRGAVVEPRWSLLVGGGALEADLRELEQTWNEQEVGRWEDELVGCDVGLAALAAGVRT